MQVEVSYGVQIGVAQDPSVQEGVSGVQCAVGA